MPWGPKRHEARRKTTRRATTAERGYGARWQRTAKAFLAHNPLCAICQRNGRTTLATCVDHVIPHKGYTVKFWQQSNWQSLCDRHHSEKTTREDGGFGRAVKQTG